MKAIDSKHGGKRLLEALVKPEEKFKMSSCVMDQFENLYQNPLESFNASSPEILNFGLDEAGPGWYTPTTFLLGMVGLCSFVALVVLMCFKAVTSVSDPEKNKKYVDFVEEDFDTQGSWRD